MPPNCQGSAGLEDCAQPHELRSRPAERRVDRRIVRPAPVKLPWLRPNCSQGGNLGANSRTSYRWRPARRCQIQDKGARTGRLHSPHPRTYENSRVCGGDDLSDFGQRITLFRAVSPIRILFVDIDILRGEAQASRPNASPDHVDRSEDRHCRAVLAPAFANVKNLGSARAAFGPISLGNLLRPTHGRAMVSRMAAGAGQNPR